MRSQPVSPRSRTRGHPGETVAFSNGRFAIAYGAASASGTRTFVTQGWDLINNLRTTEAC